MSELYQQIEPPAPSEKLDQTILSAARQQADSHHWWSKPSSWAATVTIISLVGLLAHNTWQTEQDLLDSELEQQAFPAAPAKEAVSEAYVGKQAPAMRSFQTDKKKDSRRLLYKSAPAPVLKSESVFSADNLSDSVLDTDLDARKWLENISQLLREQQLDEAQKQFTLFRKNYPDYPVDPVILRQLAP